MTEKNLFSSSWYRVADLRPFLRSHAEIHRQSFRGEIWYVLQDHSTGRFHRLTSQAYYIVGLMNGIRTLQEIWEAACVHLEDEMPTQDEVITLLSQLYHADVLQSDMSPDIANMLHRYRKERKQRFWGKIRSPIAIRIPIFDPDRFLVKTMWLVNPIFTFPAALIWCAL